MSKPPNPAPAPTQPRMLFVRNRRAALVTLHWRDEQHPAPGAAAAKYLGPGLGLVAEHQLAACSPGGRVEDFSHPLVEVLDPCAVREFEAIELASGAGSRQALYAWRKLESRPSVLAAIEARLAGPKIDATAAVVDEA